MQHQEQGNQLTGVIMITSHAHSDIHSSLIPRNFEAAQKCREKFLTAFPRGFYDKTFQAWERNSKRAAHQKWSETLNPTHFRRLLKCEQYDEIAVTAEQIESETKLLFSFERTALRKAVEDAQGAQIFSIGLYEFLHHAGTIEQRFDKWCTVINSLPGLESRSLTWPITTVFGFIARPELHLYVKSLVTRTALKAYGFNFAYRATPNGATYSEILQCAQTIAHDLADLRPRDLIDIQSFMWVLGSMEYE